MRFLQLCALLALPSFAADFTLESEAGEISKDSSSTKSTYVVSGSSVTLTVESRGRMKGPKEAPRTAKLSNTKEIEAALKAIRSTKDEKEQELMNTRFKRGCLIEGKTKLCSEIPEEGRSPRLEAIGKLEQLLLSELMK